MAGRAIQTHGVTLGVRATRADVLDALERHLPPGARPTRKTVVDRLYSIVAPINQPGSRVRKFQMAYSDAVPIARTHDLSEVFERIQADMSLATATLTPGFTFIHAGVVAWRGKAIVLPGASHAGKTTLVAALLRAGATYYSDEWAVLDASGRVRPYARSLSIRGVNGARDRAETPGSFGAKVGARPLRVGLVVFTQFDPDATWEPREVSPAHAMLHLTDNLMQLHRQPRKTLDAVRHMLDEATVLAGLRGEADPAAQQILARCGRR